jgi:hypothetical protein
MPIREATETEGFAYAVLVVDDGTDNQPSSLIFATEAKLQAHIASLDALDPKRLID